MQKLSLEDFAAIIANAPTGPCRAQAARWSDVERGVGAQAAAEAAVSLNSCSTT